ncbi:MAG: hypothetical protein K2Q33_08510 [Gammaproteobacteria bacterium]|nr:hypothetical protein [Gammaproteobacteria bacterium]
MGMTLPQATQGDFFTFFHFKEGDRKEVKPGETLIVFHTTFKQYTTTLGVVVDQNNRILQMSLFLPRDFIEDTKYGIFARDIAKSFIAACVNELEFTSVKDISDDIFYRNIGEFEEKTFKETKDVDTGKVSKDQTLLVPKGNLKVGEAAIIGSGPIPKLGNTLSDGYLVYIGKKPEFSRVMTLSTLIMENKTISDKRMLQMTGIGKGQFKTGPRNGGTMLVE